MECTSLMDNKSNGLRKSADFVLSDEQTTTSTSQFSSHGTAFVGENITELEQRWFEESQYLFRTLKWYRRPNKALLYVVVSLHSISGMILMGPLVILMLKNICSSGDEKPVHHHSMDMGPVGLPKYPIASDSSSQLVRFFSRMEMGGGSPDDCGNSNAQKILSNVQSILALISGVLGFILSGKYGQWSDRYGRVFVFKLFSVINLIHTISLLCYFDLYKSFNKPLLIAFSSTGYLSGGIMTLISNGNSYLNDIVEVENRTVAISLLMSSVYSTVGFGPLLGSLVVKVSGGSNNLTLVVSLIFALVSASLIFIFMYESRHPEAMELAREVYNKELDESLNINSNFILRLVDKLTSAIKGIFKPMTRLWIPRTEYGSSIPRINIISLVLIDVFSMAATFGTFNVMSLWVVLKFHWTSVELGYFMSLNGFGRAFVLLFIAPVILRLLEKRLGYEVYSDSVDRIDRFIVILSLIFVLLSNFLLVAIPKPAFVYLSTILQSLSGLLSPTIQSCIVKYSSKTEAGEMFGAIACVRHLTMLVLPTFFLQVYSHTVDELPDFFLYIPLIGSVFTLILAVAALRIHHEAAVASNRS